MNLPTSSGADRLILLPDDPGFYEILATPPPERGKNFVFRVGSMVQESVTEQELDDYLEGGEYDERMDEIESEILYLPCEVRVA